MSVPSSPFTKGDAPAFSRTPAPQAFGIKVALAQWAIWPLSCSFWNDFTTTPKGQQEMG